MKKQLAAYVLKLNEAAQATRRAEDRSLYERYLAHAAVILALAESDAGNEALRKAMEIHERLWGNTWLIDEVYKSPRSAWQKVKEAL